MAMVGADSGSLYRQSHKSSGLVLDRRPLGAVLHSSNEPGELSQWLCHDDSTINIVMVIIIIVSFLTYRPSEILVKSRDFFITVAVGILP